ncbi:uncharacterized protein RSE6_13798 [Rhynchosporium secalis]|uniref:Amidase domain-containing protein n=1 Tax=Rhynchosporium secalis TaxID=38038 RepID=A0A1E1MTR2_RHYSE|nr:uncharacterized protein RSE6_13798 [Rhynchosporium secalis]
MSAISDQLKTASTSWVRSIPMTFIDDKTRSFTTAVFRSLAGNYTATGDVFNTGFFQHWLSARTELPTGPYFMSTSTGELYQAYRLNSDVQGALTEGVKPNADRTFSVLSASVGRVQSVTVGVPSQLYFTKTAAKSLAGVSVGIKDIHDIAGVKKSCGNRASNDLFPVEPRPHQRSRLARHLMPLSPDMDIAGFLVRDPQPCSIDSWAYGQNFGQASYQSTLMLKTEFLPLTVDNMAAKGCDGRLLELAAALKKAGILKTPTTGSLALLKKGPRIMEFGPDNRKKRANV